MLLACCSFLNVHKSGCEEFFSLQVKFGVAVSKKGRERNGSGSFQIILRLS